MWEFNWGTFWAVLAAIAVGAYVNTLSNLRSRELAPICQKLDAILDAINEGMKGIEDESSKSETHLDFISDELIKLSSAITTWIDMQ